MALFKRKQKQEQAEQKPQKTIEEIMRDAGYEYGSPHEHLLDILDSAHSAIRWRYETGQKEHGGRLWRKDCLSKLLDELADAYVYAVTLEHQIDAIHGIVYEAREGGIEPMRALDAISAILWCGNPYGEYEETYKLGEAELPARWELLDLCTCKGRDKSKKREEEDELGDDK